MMDMGGGSTELNFFHQNTSLFSVSCPFGALSLKCSFTKNEFPDKQEWEAMQKYAFEYFSRYQAYIQTDTLYMVGGCAKAYAKLIHAIAKKSTATKGTFDIEDFHIIYDYLKDLTDCKQELLKQLLPDRYMLMLPAGALYTALLQCCHASHIQVSTGGIREGYAIELTEGGNQDERERKI